MFDHFFLYCSHVFLHQNYSPQTVKNTFSNSKINLLQYIPLLSLLKLLLPKGLS